MTGALRRAGKVKARRLRAGRPLAIGHRGASHYLPDNSLASIRLAARLGADLCEVDLRTTADGVCIASHDAALELRGLGMVTLADADWAEIAGVPTSTGHPIATLGDLIGTATACGIGLYVEIKAREAALATWREIVRHDFDDAVLGSFDLDALSLLDGSDCALPLAALVPLDEDPLALTRSSGADIAHLCWERAPGRPQHRVSPDLIECLARTGTELVLWHEERPDVIADLVALPVLGICSDRPELLSPRPPSSPGLVWHRGANRIAPENTIPAIDAAFGLGAAMVEVDVRTGADGTLLVIHDATLERTTSGAGAVSEIDATAWRALDAGRRFSDDFVGTPVPTLSAVLACASSNRGDLYIEIKSAPVSRVLAEIEAAGLLDRCLLWSGDPATLSELRAHGGAVQVMLRRRDVDDLGRALDTASPAVVEFEHARVDGAELELCRARGVRTMALYPGSDPARVDELAATGLDLINVDDGLTCRDALLARGASGSSSMPRAPTTRDEGGER